MHFAVFVFMFLSDCFVVLLGARIYMCGDFVIVRLHSGAVPCVHCVKFVVIVTVLLRVFLVFISYRQIYRQDNNNNKIVLHADHTLAFIRKNSKLFFSFDSYRWMRVFVCVLYCLLYSPRAIWTRIFMHIVQLRVFSSFIHISWHMQYASKYCLLVPQTIVALYIRRSTFLSQHMKIYEILHLGHSGTLPVASCSCVKTINRKTRKRNQILDVTLIIGRSAYYNTFEPWHNRTAPKSYSHMTLTFPYPESNQINKYKWKSTTYLSFPFHLYKRHRCWRWAAATATTSLSGNPYLLRL